MKKPDAFEKDIFEKDILATPGESSSNQKPHSVATAIKFLWASFVLGLVKTVMDFSSLQTMAPATYVYFVVFFTFVVIGYLIFRISAGENWARIAFLVMFIIGMLPSLPQLMSEFSREPVSASFFVAQIGLQIYGLYLLFSQHGSSWFLKA